jgi:hypothetical protein
MNRVLVCFAFTALTSGALAQKLKHYYDVVVIGGGAGGVAAAIQSARTGAHTLLVESTPWLGGMLTAAGVGCTDGNHQLPSGLWQEWRQAAYAHYGTRNLATGWVSNFNIEPHVGDSIFKALAAAEMRLTVVCNASAAVAATTSSAGKREITAIAVQRLGESADLVRAKVYVDATELGDVLSAAGGAYQVGLQADAETGDSLGLDSDWPVVQDLTYVAILKDFGEGSNRTIEMPKHFDPKEFDCACSTACSHPSKLFSQVDAQKMLDYGKMPNGKYMINWPAQGNDFYTNLLLMAPAQRAVALDSAKQKTLRFVYFIQTRLGFHHLGLATDEFNTPDTLPYMPYHREGRRAVGLVQLNIARIKHPFGQADLPLYRTGIAVGDYPIDHHHRAYGRGLPALHFPAVPSYNVPAGALVPASVDNLVVCDKVISVTSGANGTTRLQPVAILTGQAAGVLAALAAEERKMPAQVSVRGIQAQLLRAGAYLMPYVDVTPTDRDWMAIQMVGATGLIRGEGKPNAWANQTWFYPDSALNMPAFALGLQQFGYATANKSWPPTVSESEFLAFLRTLPSAKLARTSGSGGLTAGPISRRRAAILTNQILRPFQIPIDWTGKRLQKQ